MLYSPFNPSEFRSGIIITGIGTETPYALQIDKFKLVKSIFLKYEITEEKIDIQNSLHIARKKLKGKVFLDSKNIVNPIKTIIKKELEFY